MEKRNAETAELDASVAKHPAICNNYDIVLEELSAGNIEGLLAMKSRSSIRGYDTFTDGVFAILATLPLTLEQFQRLEAIFGPIPVRDVERLLCWQCMSLRRAPFSEPVLLELVSRIGPHSTHESNILVLALRAGSIVLPASVRDAIAARCEQTLVWRTVRVMVRDFTLDMAGFKLIAGAIDCTHTLPDCFLRCADDVLLGENALNAMVVHHQRVGGTMAWLEPACRKLASTHTSWLISKLQMYGRGLVTPEWVAAATRHMLGRHSDDLFAATLVLQTLRALLPPVQ